MKVTQQHINRFIQLTKAAVYHYENKQEYKLLGRRILKHIAEQLNLKKGEYDIRWNPGGIACSGDHTLHTDKFYLSLDDNLGSGWFYWRTVTGRRDYSGGANQIMTWKELSKGLAPLIKQLKIAQDGGWTDPNTGDFIMNINQAIRLSCKV